MRKKIYLAFLIIIFLVINFNMAGNFARADDAEDYQKKIDKLTNKAEDAQKQLENSQGALAKTQVQIGTTRSVLKQTEAEMARKEAEISNLEQRIELNKTVLESYIQEAYFMDEEPLTVFLASDNNFDGMSENFDQMVGLKEKILATLDEINASKNDLEKAKEDLDNKKEDHEQLLSLQQGQQNAIQGNIKETQATLSELNAKINKLKSELSSLLGSNVSFKNVMDAADFAARGTGVRKDFLLGMLVVESGLGKYTGGCTAEKSNMSKSRLSIFQSICKDLGYDWKKKKVSCPPSSYKGTGGAMGVAQFMSDTWMGYKSSIAGKTGNNPPDPWSLTDGVTAMALKLARGGATSKSGECNAAKLYLSGSTSKTYDWYCDRVSYWSKNYEQKMQ
jgi:peptidoglycan hydrolase CwlO-like protein